MLAKVDSRARWSSWKSFWYLILISSTRWGLQNIQHTLCLQSGFSALFKHWRNPSKWHRGRVSTSMQVTYDLMSQCTNHTFYNTLRPSAHLYWPVCHREPEGLNCHGKINGVALSLVFKDGTCSCSLFSTNRKFANPFIFPHHLSCNCQCLSLLNKFSWHLQER